MPVGVSNPTVLLNAVTTKAGVITYHGPSVVWDFGAESGAPELTTSPFFGLLESAAPAYEVPVRDGWRWLREGKLSGRIIAGNLASLQGLIGTPYEPDWDNAVLMWEDVAKPVNRLDMMLTHFHDAGVFDRINGMVVGQLDRKAAVPGSVFVAPATSGGHSSARKLGPLARRLAF